MKHLIYIIALLLIFNINAQEKVKDSTNTDINKITTSETERLIDKYSGKIADNFNEVVNKITPLAEDGFSLAVKFKIAEGIAYLLPFIFFIISLLLLKREYDSINTLLKSDNVPSSMDKRYGPMDNDNISFILLLYVIFTFVFFILTCFTLFKGITYSIVPEWFAIKEIIELF